MQSAERGDATGVAARDCPLQQNGQSGWAAEQKVQSLTIQAGTRVTIVLKNVPSVVVTERNPALPFILHGLLQHEHKQSVLHFVVHRNTEYDEPVKAKVRRESID